MGFVAHCRGSLLHTLNRLPCFQFEIDGCRGAGKKEDLACLELLPLHPRTELSWSHFEADEDIQRHLEDRNSLIGTVNPNGTLLLMG